MAAPLRAQPLTPHTTHSLRALPTLTSSLSIQVARFLQPRDLPELGCLQNEWQVCPFAGLCPTEPRAHLPGSCRRGSAVNFPPPFSSLTRVQGAQGWRRHPTHLPGDSWSSLWPERMGLPVLPLSQGGTEGLEKLLSAQMFHNF